MHQTNTQSFQTVVPSLSCLQTPSVLISLIGSPNLTWYRLVQKKEMPQTCDIIKKVWCQIMNQENEIIFGSAIATQNYTAVKQMVRSRIDVW